MTPEPGIVTIAWAVLLFGAGVGFGHAIFGSNRTVRQRAVSALVDLAMATLATSSLIQVSLGTARYALAIAVALVFAAGLVLIWPQPKRTT